jgi:hypothetical protein
MKVKRICFGVLFLLSLIFSFRLSAQNDETGFLEVRGDALKDGKPFAGANVKATRNGQTYAEVTTKKNGNYLFELEFGHEYVLNFSAPGQYDMRILVSSKVPASQKLPFFPLYKIDVPFYDLSDATVNKNVFNRAITKVYYDENAKQFKDDENYVDPTEKENPTVAITPITKVETGNKLNEKPKNAKTVATTQKNQNSVAKNQQQPEENLDTVAEVSVDSANIIATDTTTTSLGDSSSIETNEVKDSSPAFYKSWWFLLIIGGAALWLLWFLFLRKKNKEDETKLPNKEV